MLTHMILTKRKRKLKIRREIRIINKHLTKQRKREENTKRIDNFYRIIGLVISFDDL